jgi:hypothetical protein
MGKTKFQCKRKEIIHSHRDLNSVSSSTDKTNLSGPIPSRLRSPAPRVCNPPRAVASSVGGNTSLSLKPAARNSLELIRIDTGDRDQCVNVRRPLLERESWRILGWSSSTLLSQRLMTREESEYSCVMSPALNVNTHEGPSVAQSLFSPIDCNTQVPVW